MAKRRREEEVTVFLGGESSLEGVLSFSGQARLDGSFTGEVKGKGTLMVGPSARVKAQIEATAVVISGEVIGDVVATDRIEMHAPGKLTGNITAPLVVMDEGVLFEGNCRMASGAIDERAARAGKMRLISEGAPAS